MPEAMALRVQAPQINTVESYQQGAANQLQFNAEEMRQTKQRIQDMSAVALGVMGGDLNGKPNPERWQQAIDMYQSQSGVDLSSFRDRPDLAQTIARAGLDTMQQLNVARDERDYKLALQRFNQSVSNAAAARALAREKFDYQKTRDQEELTRQAAQQEADRLALLNAPAKPNSSLGKIAADFEAGLIDEATYKAAIAKATASSNGVTITNPDGTVTQIGGSSMPKLTEGQSKNTSFLIRAQNSNAILDSLENEGTDFGAKIKSGVPFNLGNFAQTPEYQQYDQAKRDFINAQLRKESGAVISEEEFANAEIQYFPQPGDSAAVIAQKRRNRQDAIKGFEIGAGPGAAAVNQGVSGGDLIVDYTDYFKD